MIDLKVQSPSFYINFPKLSFALENIFHIVEISTKSLSTKTTELPLSAFKTNFRRALLIPRWIHVLKHLHYNNKKG